MISSIVEFSFLSILVFHLLLALTVLLTIVHSFLLAFLFILNYSIRSIGNSKVLLNHLVSFRLSIFLYLYRAS